MHYISTMLNVNGKAIDDTLQWLCHNESYLIKINANF